MLNLAILYLKKFSFVANLATPKQSIIFPKTICIPLFSLYQFLMRNIFLKLISRFVFLIFFACMSLLAGNCMVLQAQTDSSKVNKHQRAEPMDLPNAIIYGEAYLNVGSSVKQSPTDTPRLEARDLDSLNSLEKQSAMLLPASGLSKDIFTRKEKKGFLNFDFGQYITPSLELAYKTKLGSYNLYSNAGFSYSDGHIKDAGYTKMFIDLKSDYIAPDKFWLFGGSKTRTNLFFNLDNYKNYAGNSFYPEKLTYISENRTRKNLGVSLETDGNYDDYTFQTGFKFNLAGISGDSTDLSEQLLRGFLRVTNPMNDFRLGINLDLSLGSVNTVGTSFTQANLFGGYQIEDFELLFEGGLQISKGNIGNTKVYPFLKTSTSIKLNQYLTFGAEAMSGVENNNFTQMMYFNPYLKSNVDFQYTQDLIKLSSNLWYHPNKDFGVRFRASFSKNTNQAVYSLYLDNQNQAIVNRYSYQISYLDATILKTSADIYYNLNEKSNIGIKIDLYSSNLDGLNSKIPYIAPVNVTGTYKLYWIENLYSNFQIQYIGERAADIEPNRKISLPAYFRANIENTYIIADNLSVNLGVYNLFDSNIQIWEAYYERGIFVNIGLNWQF